MNISIRNKHIQSAIKLFTCSMIFYCLFFRMFRDGYASYPIQVEPALITIAIASFFNMGFFLACSEKGQKYKVATMIWVIIACFIDLLIVLDTAGNPFGYLENAYWNNVKFLLLIIIFLMSLFTVVLVGVNKSDT